MPTLPAFIDPGQLERVAKFLGIGGPPKTQPTVRIGVLGASQVATYAMLWPARRVPGAEVVAVAARDGARAQEYAKQHGIARSYGSYEALLADPEVDAVYVGLPNGLHGAWAAAALAAGKHVLCEKPFTANQQEAIEVQALARRKRLVCREAFHYREHPLMHHLVQLLGGGGGSSSGQGGGSSSIGANGGGAAGAGGPLGRLRSLEAQVLIPKWVFGGANIRFQETLAGGAAMDAGCYCLHAIRTLAAAAGAVGLPWVESAQAELASPTSQVVDGAMRGTLRWRGGGGGGGSGSGAQQEDVTARFAASLQWEGLLPRSTIDLEGDRGRMHVSNFIMPVFGHVVRLSTTTATTTTATATSNNSTGGGGTTTGTAPAATSTTSTTLRVYGTGESTYWHQLSRFVADVRAVDEAVDSGDEGALLAAARLLAADEMDCVANMGLLDDVYRAAGLRPRLPSAQAVALAQQQQQAAAAASKAAAQAAGGAAGQAEAGTSL
ncbi:hypothetical protein HXX76_014799 [Chlamydomonas incerta]|uniref:D-xylose 1-dehydrogenase (NADP(+), D-xylono-1,5-lactone-forming) n=1 Tax=Chlamydomonas incerta TaxID=51695 RepID=A0A835SNX1_CHLIN|nr:hypothetical protein HXX76_014799 [Chlamydomonas incerta]|eukprot:KAG2424125.1 hypothetical protein HXX76_014799 [Chlamydomonas incerta]